MTQIAWGSSLEIGIPEIDAEHRQMVNLLNDLVAASDKPDQSEVRRILLLLEEYTVAHFAHEERLMTATAYPGTASHCEEHRRLFAEIGEQIEEMNSGRLVAASVAMFMQGWLIRHIVGADRQFGLALQARQMSRA